jgi:Ca-activated chloride channel family protein
MNLEHPWYLLVPLIAVAASALIAKTKKNGDLTKIADPHLLKYIINLPAAKNLSKYLTMLGVICLLSLALANPRWGQREHQLYSGNAAAVIILDVSSHMSASDVRPTRGIRARQIASEIVNSLPQVNFGLVAFAKNAHLIMPITDDKNTLNNYLPVVDHKLVYQQGQELDATLSLANEMLASETSHKKSIILLSAGNFNVQSLKNKYPIYAIGVGTSQGAPMQDRDEQHIYSNGKLQITKLNDSVLKALAVKSGGKYFSYIDLQGNVNILNKNLLSEQAHSAAGQTIKTWHDGYAYILLLSAVIIIIAMRKGLIALSLAAIVVLLPINDSYALDLTTLFKNNEQQAKMAVDKLDFQNAAQLFADPYNKGVSLYKLGKYDLAVEEFNKNTRAEVKTDALYNAGNANYMLEKYQAAIDDYKSVLAIEPDNLDAKFNLELATKKLAEQQKNEQDCECDKSKDDKQNKDDLQNKDNKLGKNNASDNDNASTDNKNKLQPAKSDDKQQNDQSTSPDKLENESAKQKEQQNQQPQDAQQDAQQGNKNSNNKLRKTAKLWLKIKRKD